MSSLDSFFRPRGVAFIGATEDPSKLGGRRYRSLVEDGFEGAIYPVHPKAESLRGIPAYRSVRDVPDPLDLAVVVVPATSAPAAVAECAARGVPAVVMITAGFGEVDEEGRRIERGMVEVLRRAGARMLGPNASGLFDARSKLNVGGSAVPRGSVGLVSQSGNLLLDFNQHARERGLGFSRQIAIGNAADLGAPEVIEDCISDPETRVVLAYLEGWGAGEGRALFEVVRRCGGDKPVVFLKPGRSDVGRRAVLSHTGTLAGEERIVGAALRQCGILRADSIEGAWDLAAALCAGVSPVGERVAVISDGGGHSSVLCDALGLAGFSVPPFCAETREALRAFLPPRAATANPVDFAGVAETEPDVLPRTTAVCLGAPQIDAVVVAGHFGGYHKIGGEALEAREVKAARKVAGQDRRARPFIFHSIYANEPLEAHRVLRESGIPVLRSPEGAARLLCGLRQAHLARGRRSPHIERLSAPDRRTVEAILSRAECGVLLEPEAREVVAAYGIGVPPFRVVDSAEACAQAVAADGPCALKLLVPGLVHRTEAGGVRLNVVGRRAATESFHALMAKAPHDQRRAARVLVCAMIATGVEVILGAFRDPQFGPVVMFGLGGVAVEALGDVSFRLAPLSLAEARAMLDELRSRSLLEGHRGAQPADRESAAGMLVRLGEILSDLPEVAEIDLNPVFLDASSARLADARVILTTTVRSTGKMAGAVRSSGSGR